MNAERIDLDAIEARAKAATPGPWEQDRYQDGDESGPIARMLPDFDLLHLFTDYDGVTAPELLMTAASPADAAHIAGMDPPTTLVLVAELRAARPALDSARSFLAMIDAIERGEIPAVAYTEARTLLVAGLNEYDEAAGR